MYLSRLVLCFCFANSFHCGRYYIYYEKIEEHDESAEIIEKKLQYNTNKKIRSMYVCFHALELRRFDSTVIKMLAMSPPPPPPPPPRSLVDSILPTNVFECGVCRWRAMWQSTGIYSSVKHCNTSRS